MIKNVKVTNYLGESITINMRGLAQEHGLLIKKIDGLGPVKGNINTSELASFDGTVYNSSRLDERNIVITLVFDNSCGMSIESIRQLTYKYFPIKKFLTFGIETDNRIAEATGYVESNEPDIFNNKFEETKISILCPDPNFYSAGDDGTKVVEFFGMTPLFEFPFENEDVEEPTIEFGRIENKTDNVITYDGDLETGILMRMHAIGEVGDITIYNVGTRERMGISASRIQEITGTGIVNGDDIIVSTIRGDKYVTLLREGVYTNILNALDRDSRWFQLSKGDNIFAYITTFGPEYLQFSMEYRIVYEGV